MEQFRISVIGEHKFPTVQVITLTKYRLLLHFLNVVILRQVKMGQSKYEVPPGSYQLFVRREIDSLTSISCLVVYN